MRKINFSLTFFFILVLFMGLVNGTQAELIDDAAVLQYCQLNKDVHVAILFPYALNKSIDYDVIKKIFNNFGCILYEKDVELSEFGALNLIWIAYEDEPWIGSSSSRQLNVVKRFTSKSKTGFYSIKAILFECKNIKTVVKCKSAIRDLFNYGPWPIHINDTHKETLTLARILFCKNSIDFINRAHFKKFAHFDKCIAYYKKFLDKKKFDWECFCIVGSAVKAAYGLRDCDELDFIHHGYDFLPEELKTDKIIHSRNLDTLKNYPNTKDEIIFNPENYFYYKNLKFATLQEGCTAKSTKISDLPPQSI